jgi:hypothetical protein
MTTVSPADRAPAGQPGIPAGIRLPPSARKIYALFSDGKAHTIQELKKTTGLSLRCTRYAVQLLKQNSLIIARFNFRDARQPLYQSAAGYHAADAAWPYPVRSIRPVS